MDRLDEWMEVKRRLNEFNGRPPYIRKGEVWWVSVGENIGVEINGKGNLFTRPVLILKELRPFGFIGIPLTSQEHGGSWYVKFPFRDRESYAVLVQIKSFSVKRLSNRLGQIDEGDFLTIKRGLFNLLFD